MFSQGQSKPEERVNPQVVWQKSELDRIKQAGRSPFKAIVIRERDWTMVCRNKGRQSFKRWDELRGRYWRTVKKKVVNCTGSPLQKFGFCSSAEPGRGHCYDMNMKCCPQGHIPSCWRSLEDAMESSGIWRNGQAGLDFEAYTQASGLSLSASWSVLCN